MPSPIRRNPQPVIAPPVQKPIKLAFLGDPNTGKTHFTKTLQKKHGTSLQHHVTAANKSTKQKPLKMVNQHSTVGCDLVALRLHQQKSGSSTKASPFVPLSIWDLSGQRGFEPLRSEFYKESQAVLLFCSANNRLSCTSLEKWANEVQQVCGGSSGSVPRLYVVINKGLLTGASSGSASLARDFALGKNVGCLECDCGDEASCEGVLSRVVADLVSVV